MLSSRRSGALARGCGQTHAWGSTNSKLHRSNNVSLSRIANMRFAYNAWDLLSQTVSIPSLGASHPS